MREIKRITLTLLSAVMILAGIAFMPILRTETAYAEDAASAEDADTAVSPVHTIYWQVQITGNIKVRDFNTGEKFRIKKNTLAVVTSRTNSRLTESLNTVTLDGHTFRIPNRYLNFKRDLATVVAQGDYNQATKENFVNESRHLSSSSQYLIWVCLDKQRVNVFTGSRDNWTLYRSFLTSTGKAKYPTPVKVDRVNFKKLDYRIEGSHVRYFVEAVGSGFHQWPNRRTPNRKYWGKRTVSHGCIRLSKADAKWLYDNVDVGTRIIIF